MWADAESLGLYWPSLSAGISTEKSRGHSAQTIFPISLSRCDSNVVDMAGHLRGCLPALGTVGPMLLQKHALH